jgi:hypothetical protein
MAAAESPVRCRLPRAAEECSKGDSQNFGRGSAGEQNDKGREVTEEHQEPYTERAGINEVEDQDGGIVHSVPTGRGLAGILHTSRRTRCLGDVRVGLPVPITARSVQDLLGG